jgi:hypothetical protein
MGSLAPQDKPFSPVYPVLLDLIQGCRELADPAKVQRLSLEYLLARSCCTLLSSFLELATMAEAERAGTQDLVSGLLPRVVT